MSYQPILVTPAAETVVSVADLKAHLNIDSADDDAYIGSLISAATDRLDGIRSPLNVALVSQVWRQDFDRFCSVMRLPLGPVSGIVEVGYLDEAHAAQVVAASNYYLMTDQVGPYVEFDDDYSFQSTSTRRAVVSITFTAGYADANAVPDTYKHMIRMTVAHWYENREAVVTDTSAMHLPLAVQDMFSQNRRFV